MKSLRLLVSVCTIVACVAVAILTSRAHYVNSINFLGAKHAVDPESEFRLMQLGRVIVEAKRADTDVSLAVKDAYAASILGDKSAHDANIAEAQRLGTMAQRQWASVAQNISEVVTWLDGNLRKEYTEAFKKIALSKDFHSELVTKGISSRDMKWAFDRIAKICSETGDGTQAILKCLLELKKLAEETSEASVKFTQHLGKITNEPKFTLYRHIFDNLAIRAKKPELFSLDEGYFVKNNEFLVFYEAVEQVSREAHTIVPGTHDQKFETFDLKFTKAPRDNR